MTFFRFSKMMNRCYWNHRFPVYLTSRGRCTNIYIYKIKTPVFIGALRKKNVIGHFPVYILRILYLFIHTNQTLLKILLFRVRVGYITNAIFSNLMDKIFQQPVRAEQNYMHLLVNRIFFKLMKYATLRCVCYRFSQKSQIILHNNTVNNYAQ